MIVKMRAKLEGRTAFFVLLANNSTNLRARLLQLHIIIYPVVNASHAHGYYRVEVISFSFRFHFTVCCSRLFLNAALVCEGTGACRFIAPLACLSARIKWTITANWSDEWWQLRSIWKADRREKRNWPDGWTTEWQSSNFISASNSNNYDCWPISSAINQAEMPSLITNRSEQTGRPSCFSFKVPILEKIFHI